MNIGVLGSGVVGETLANGFLKHGYPVMRGSREPAKLAAWKDKAGGKAQVGTFAQAAAFGELLVLAVKGEAAEAVVKLAGVDALAGKTCIDTANPIGPGAPVDGVLPFFTDFKQSLMEKLQVLAPKANFVKAFSCVGSGLMVNPALQGGLKPSMFICGNHAQAKKQVGDVLAKFGWETEDMGSAVAARAIEPLCMLWCIPGLSGGSWSHAYKVLRG